jgi:hypothetical protein
VALQCAPIIDQAGPRANATLFGVSLRLPMASELPLYETVTSVSRRFFGSLGQATACHYLIVWGVGPKEQWRVEKLRAGPK